MADKAADPVKELARAVEALREAQGILHALKGLPEYTAEHRNRCLYYVGQAIRETNNLRKMTDPR